jgi:D-alanyl-D-alanine dipeptidase
VKYSVKILVTLLFFSSCQFENKRGNTQLLHKKVTPKNESIDPPEGFVYLQNQLEDLKVEPRYYSNNNFVGDTIDGYLSVKYMISKVAYDSLNKVAEEVRMDAYGLKVFDAYRPQQAVDHFVRWAKNLSDTAMKSEYYPEVDKKDLFALGYIAEKSSHSRGSTVDITLYSLLDNSEIDMGSQWDYFGPRSGYGFSDLSDRQKANRAYLRKVMVKHGFKPLQEEWWHFTLKNEPFADTSFNFPVQ